MRTVLLLALAAAAHGVSAQGLSVEPVTLAIAPGERSGSVWLFNDGTRPVRVVASVFAWRQQDGEEVLAPATDIGISPPAVDVPPGVRQRLRAVRLGAAEAAVERSYRLIVDEHPAGDDEAVVRYSLPLFVESAGAAGAALLVCVVSGQSQQTWLRIRNPGGRHAKLVDLRYLPPQGPARPLISDLAGYVLPGSYKHWRLDGAPQDFAQGRFAAQVNGEPRSWPSARCG